MLSNKEGKLYAAFVDSETVFRAARRYVRKR